MNVERLKGYKLDPASKRRWHWRPSTFVLGSALLGGAGAFLYHGFAAKEAEERGVERQRESRRKKRRLEEDGVSDQVRKK